MIALGFRTVDGRLLEEIDSLVEMSETHATQRIMAENVYAYAFPSTFLLPYLIEPLATIILPWLFGEWIVGIHPEITGPDAEDFLAAPKMDLGRYADIMLNTFLGIFFLYFPGGRTHQLFLVMAVSHMWIYFVDYLRQQDDGALRGEACLQFCRRGELAPPPMRRLADTCCSTAHGKPSSESLIASAYKSSSGKEADVFMSSEPALPQEARHRQMRQLRIVRQRPRHGWRPS